MNSSENKISRKLTQIHPSFLPPEGYNRIYSEHFLGSRIEIENGTSSTMEPLAAVPFLFKISSKLKQNILSD
jgi:hypothetical protein